MRLHIRRCGPCSSGIGGAWLSLIRRVVARDGTPTLDRLVDFARRTANPDNAPMSLVTLLNAHIAFGERPLLDGAQLTVQAGERLGLIGRNGTGKSTLLAVLAGKTPLDDGELQRREGLRLALVEQEPELPLAETLQDSLRLRAKICTVSSDGASADEREHWRLESR